MPLDLDTAYRIAELSVAAAGVGAILYRLGRMTEKFEQIGQQQAGEIRDLKDAIKEMAQVLIKTERIEARQLAEGKRVDSLEEEIRQLRRERRA